MSKKILVIVGSYRLNGNTDSLADSFIEGAREAGHNVTKFSLARNRVNGCLGCDLCFSKDRPCIQSDGMDEIYDVFEQCDTIVLATPLYFHTISSGIKAVIERLYAIGSQNAWEYPKKDCVLLVTAADEDDETFNQIVSYYQFNMIHYMKWNDKGMILAGGYDSTSTHTLGNIRHLRSAFRLGNSMYRDP
jgi:multimeric flavodoxin WrbA